MKAPPFSFVWNICSWLTSMNVWLRLLLCVTEIIKENVMDNLIWVVAFDKVTGIRAAFTVCAPANAEFYRSKYEFDGYNAKVLTAEQSMQLAEEEKKRGIM